MNIRHYIHTAFICGAFFTFGSVANAAPAKEEIQDRPYIGSMQTMRARYEDTLLKIMRAHDLGYVEIRAANPGVDVWIPGEGTKIILPTRHLLPDAPREGIVINLSEMRLYNFANDKHNPVTFPIGVGREGLNTPTGKTSIVRKIEGPTWRPTPRMREEKPELPAAVPPGDDNPLGTHALYLGWPQYLIHGTHRPWGIGRRVSSGCIRMYPEDIIKFFDMIPAGTPVHVVKQPLKMAWIDDVLYLEAHADDELADDIERDGEIRDYEVPSTLFTLLRKKAGTYYDELDWDHIKTVVKERRGYPIAIYDVKEEAARKERQAQEDEDKAQAALKAEQDEADKPKFEAGSKSVIRADKKKYQFNN